MIELNIYRGVLKRRLPLVDKVSFVDGANWLLGAAGSGKTTLLDVLRDFKKYQFQKEIHTSLELSSTEMLHVSFESCTCSNDQLNKNFDFLRQCLSSEEARLNFLSVLSEEVNLSKDYKLVLLDDPLRFISQGNIPEILKIIEAIAKKSIVVATYSGGGNSKELLSGNLIQLRDKL